MRLKRKKWLGLNKALCMVLAFLLIAASAPIGSTFASDMAETDAEAVVSDVAETGAEGVVSDMPEPGAEGDASDMTETGAEAVVSDMTETGAEGDASDMTETDAEDDASIAAEKTQITISPFSLTTPNVNTPLGGNTIASGDGAKLVVMEAGGDSTTGTGYYAAYTYTNAAASATSALQSALWDLYTYSNANSGRSYIMYVGTSMTEITGANANIIFGTNTAPTGTTDVTFASLGSVDTLVLTASALDPCVTTPATAVAQAGTIQFTPNAANAYFGCDVVVRNIRHSLGTNVYMQGYGLTLYGNSWQTSATSYYGGGASGTITPVSGTASIDVYSTSVGVGASSFYGGSQAGTFIGNTEINIHNTSGNVINIYGGSQAGTLNGSVETNIYNTSGSATISLYGGMNAGTLNGNVETNIYNTGGSTTINLYGGGNGTAANTANVTGNVTNTITGMSSTGGGVNFFGGVNYGFITGQITNTISGPGRLSAAYVGGSANGNIGTTEGGARYGDGIDAEGLELDEGDNYKKLLEMDNYAIRNNVDTSGYSNGNVAYFGVTQNNAIIRGNVINIIKAGTNGAGGYTVVNPTSRTEITGSWNSAANFSPNSSTGKLGTPETGAAAAKTASASRFQIYGDIVNIIRSGRVSNGGGDVGCYLQGAGYGYVEGNAYTAVGTEGIAYPGADTNNNYTYSTTNKTKGNNSGWDIVGGGGYAGDNSFFIYGDTTVVLREVVARWTYGGTFAGCQIGDSKIELHKGVVDTLEGTGYSGLYQKGNGRAEVYGGQVDWFLSGGGWDDEYTDGNVSVEVFDGPDVWINASMGGTYGSQFISGNSDIVVHGGNFSGTARTGVTNGFCAGPSLEGAIYGDASVTLDLRGNQNGFKLAAGDCVSGGRRYNADAGVLGTNGNNTITLNIFTNDSATDLLNGLNVYGDGASSSGNTKAGSITININAPNANLGNVYATYYNNLSGTGVNATLIRDVEINLVSAGTIKGLSSGNGAESFTNARISASAAIGKYAVINVGPQSSDPTDPLGDREETIETLDGLPHTIKVAGGGLGIMGFTSMDINKRLLIAEDGSIKNGGTAVTLANHSSTYNLFGNVTLHAGDGQDASGIGVSLDSSYFYAGALKVEGNGTAYVQSPGVQNQIVFTDATVDDYLTWLKVGSQTQYTTLNTTWFGATKGWFVFTLDQNGLTNAQKMTPINLRGLEKTTGKTFIGDNDVKLSATYGYAVAIPASVYTWEVTEGEGMISHNVEVSDSLPSSGYINAYGTVAKDTPSKQGMIAIPSENMPSPVAYPEFTFTPDVVLGEWVKGIQIHNSDEYITPTPHQNCIDITEQSIASYYVDPVMKWTTTIAQVDYSFDIAAQYTSDAQLTAQSVIITETEAAAIANAADIIAYNQAEGRPFFANNITAALIEAIQQPLAEGTYMRVHPVTYTAGDVALQGIDKQMTVNVIVVKDETVLSDDRTYGIYASDAVIELSAAQALSGQPELDSDYTYAIAILANGNTAIPDIDSAAIPSITGTTAAEVPKDVSVTYTYAPDAVSTAVDITVTVTVVGSGSITIEKLGDKDSSIALTGAEFTIERWDSSANGGVGGWVYIEYDTVTKTWSDTASGGTRYTQITAGAKGSTTFADLPLNKYRIQEVTPPTGYTTLNSPIETEVPYTIDSDDPYYSTVTSGKTPDRTVTDGTVTTAYYYNMTYTITDMAELNMPSAGIGVSPVVIILAGLGIALLAAGGYIFYRRRRAVDRC